MIVYDCVFVFASDVMVTVATKIDNPMKFIFPSDLAQLIHLTVDYSSSTK